MYLCLAVDAALVRALEPVGEKKCCILNISYTCSYDSRNKNIGRKSLMKSYLGVDAAWIGRWSLHRAKREHFLLGFIK